MNLPLGEIILADIRKAGLSVTYVAERMGMSRKGLSDLLKRDDMSLSQLNGLSEILNKDYFELYKSRLETKAGKKLDYLVSEPDADSLWANTPQVKISNEISLSVKIFGDMDRLRDTLPDFLAVIQKEAEIRGLHLG